MANWVMDKPGHDIQGLSPQDVLHSKPKQAVTHSDALFNLNETRRRMNCVSKRGKLRAPRTWTAGPCRIRNGTRCEARSVR